MREAWLIARREYLERIRSKAFRISTVLIPVFFGLIFAIGALTGKLGVGAGRVVVASDNPVLAESVRAELMTAGIGARSSVRADSGARGDQKRRAKRDKAPPLLAA